MAMRPPRLNGLHADLIIMDDPLGDEDYISPIDHWSSPDGCHDDCPACADETAHAQAQAGDEAITQLAQELAMPSTAWESQYHLGPDGRPSTEARIGRDELQESSDIVDAIRYSIVNAPDAQPAADSIGVGLRRLAQNNPVIQRAIQFGQTYGMSAERLRERLAPRVAENMVIQGQEAQRMARDLGLPMAQMSESMQQMANAFGIAGEAAAERLTQIINEANGDTPMVIDIETGGLRPARPTEHFMAPVAGTYNVNGQAQYRQAGESIEVRGSMRSNRIYDPPLHHNARSRARTPDERWQVGDVVLVRDIYTEGFEHAIIIASIGGRDINFGMGYPTQVNNELVYGGDSMPLIGVNGVLMPVLRHADQPEIGGLEAGDEITVELPNAEGLRRNLEIVSVRTDSNIRVGSQSLVEGELVMNPRTRNLYVGVSGQFILLTHAPELARAEGEDRNRLMEFVGGDFSQGEARMMPEYGDLEARVVADMARRIAQDINPTILNPDGTPLNLMGQAPQMAAEPALITFKPIMQIPVTQLEDLRTAKDGVEFRPTSTLECQMEQRTGRYNMEMTLDFYIDREAMHDPAKMAETVGDLAHRFILNLMRQEGIIPQSRAQALALPELGVRKITKDEEPK